MKKLSAIAADIARAALSPPEPVYWVGEVPERCDICNKRVITTFVDARTRSGSWGNLDLQCHRIHGVGTGKGKGQTYHLQGDGRWLKIAG